MARKRKAGWLAWLEACARAWGSLGNAEQANRVLAFRDKHRDVKDCSVCQYRETVTRDA